MRLISFGLACVLTASSIDAAAQTGLMPIGSPFVTRPAGSVARAVDWVDAVLTHVPGAADEPTKIVGAWSQMVVANLRVELASIRRLMRDPRTNTFPLPIELDRGRPKEIRYSSSERKALAEATSSVAKMSLSDGDLITRAIVLHTDIATLAGGIGLMLSYADGGRTNLNVGAADHWAAARALADDLDTEAGRNADLAFWYRATLAHMASLQVWIAAHAEHALARFPDEAELQFLVGCLHETLASARTQAVLANGRLPPGLTVRVGSPDGELDRAGSLQRRALELNPHHTEARVHYGRVLTLTGKTDTGISELRRAVGDSTEPTQQYYAQLFLGAALESANKRAEAAAAYRAVATLFPDAQAPRLALSQLALSSGDRAGASEAIAPMLALPPDEDQQQDPWWTYFVSCGHDAEALLAEARRRLVTPTGAAMR